MSWIDRLQENMTITTGEGSVWSPLWKPAKVLQEFNLAEFDSPGVDGTYVVHYSTKGNRHQMEFYFQGENHLEITEAFKVAATDRRPWTLSHPLNGSITVKPVSLEYDNSGLNTTRISGVIIETLTEDYPQAAQDPINVIEALADTVNDSFASVFDVESLGTSAISDLESNLEVYYSVASVQIEDDTIANEYLNAFNKSKSLLLSASNAPLNAIIQAQNMINLPFQFEISVKQRIEIFTGQLDRLFETVTNLTTTDEKKVYENNAGALLTGLILSTVTPIDGDYEKRSEVVDTIETVIDYYNSSVTNLDLISDEKVGINDPFTPDATSQRQLRELVTYALSKLFVITDDAKQERIFYCDRDTNVILLAHRFYGLDDQDVNIDKLINDNDISMDELFNVKHGREIKYYV